MECIEVVEYNYTVYKLYIIHKLQRIYWKKIFSISNYGYGVQTYSAASLKPYIKFSKERVLNVSIQKELFN